MIKDAQFLYLTTTGHQSGETHEIEIWFVEHHDKYYLVAERREKSHWVQNIQHDPSITFWVKGTTNHGTGRIIDNNAEPDLSKAVSNLMDAKYKWSNGLIVELSPE